MDVEEKRLKRNAYMREWKKRNADKVLALGRTYKAANVEKVKEWNKRSRARHPETDKKAQKRYREKHPEKVRALSKAWFAKHPEYAMQWRLDNLENWILKSARSRAKQNGLPFTVTEADIVIPDICPALGIRLKREARRGLPDSLSLDRILPNLGYVPGNVRVISCRANRLKSDATAEELDMLAAYIRREAPSAP